MTNTTTKELIVVRLNSEIYLKLEKQLSKTVVTEATTAFTAGHALGVESVLKLLRNGLTVERSDVSTA